VQHIRGVSGPITGHYRVAGISGLTTGLGANAPIFSARFATAAYIRAAITRLKVTALIITPFTAANEVSFAASFASAFTASDSTGTSLVPASGQNSLVQVSDQPSVFTDIRICGAAALTPGARTLDTNPFMAALGNQDLAAASAAVAPIIADYDLSSDQHTCIVLQGTTPTIGQQAIAGVQPPATPAAIAANAQGIVVASTIAQGVGGTVRFLVEMEWLEFATNAAEAIN
jgi:hypothetical protein